MEFIKKYGLWLGLGLVAAIAGIWYYKKSQSGKSTSGTTSPTGTGAANTASQAPAVTTVDTLLTSGVNSTPVTSIAIQAPVNNMAVFSASYNGQTVSAQIDLAVSNGTATTNGITVQWIKTASNLFNFTIKEPNKMPVQLGNYQLSNGVFTKV